MPEIDTTFDRSATNTLSISNVYNRQYIALHKRLSQTTASIYVKRIDLLMLDKTFPPENTPRSPIPAMIELLKGAPDQENIRVLIARHLATAVHNRDSEEVFYWAVIHYGVVGGDVDPDVRDVLLEALNQAEAQRG